MFAYFDTLHSVVLRNVVEARVFRKTLLVPPFLLLRGLKCKCCPNEIVKFLQIGLCTLYKINPKLVIICKKL